MSIYANLIPKEKPVEPEKKGFFARAVDKVKSVFTGEKKPETKTELPAPAPIRDDSKFKDLVPSSGVTPAKKSHGIYAPLVPEAPAAAPPKESGTKKFVDAYKKQVDRKIGSLAAGIFEGTGGMVRSVELFGNRLLQKAPRPFGGVVRGQTVQQGVNKEDSFGVQFQEKAKRGAEIMRAGGGITPGNQTFPEKAIEGLGSSLPYFVPGVGISRVAQASTVAPKMAYLFGNVAASSLEAMAEGGQVYDALVKEKGEEAAMAAADRTFLANAVLLTVTERLGIFNPNVKSLLKRALVSMPTEGLQEAVQQIIQNRETGRDIWEGVLEAGAIGAVVGGVLGPVTGIAARQQEGVKLYRGENKSNEGGVHWTFDKAEAEHFAGPKGHVIEAPLPVKLTPDTEAGIQDTIREAAAQGLDTTEMYKLLFSKGYQAISSTDPMTGKPDVIQDPSTVQPVQEFAPNVPSQIVDKEKNKFIDLVPQKPVDVPAIQEQIEKTRAVAAPVERPETPEQARAGFSSAVIEPSIARGEAVVLGADQLRYHFGELDDSRQKLFSTSAFGLFNDYLPRFENKVVRFTAGAPATAKTETINAILKPNFNGLIYDSNFANLEGATKQIASVRAAGKAPQVFINQVNIYTSRIYSLKRGDEGGHKITTETFVRQHELAPKTVLSLLKRGILKPDEVFITDLRKATTAEELADAMSKGFVSNPVATLEEMVYSRDEIAAIEKKATDDYAKRKTTVDTGGSDRDVQVSGERGADKGTADEGSGGAGVLQEETQQQKVARAVKEGPKSIKQAAEETGILEPNIRRILGVGTKDGVFERVDKGVYILKKDEQDIAFVHTGDALETLPKLAKEGFKADMVFLDIPYNAAGNRGGNRFNEEKGTLYETISPEQFDEFLGTVKTVLTSEDAPVVYMFSQSRSSAKEMQRYTDAFEKNGLAAVARGNYSKTYKDGKPVKFGQYTLEPEGIIVFSQSGKLARELGELDFTFVRPNGYKTEKAEGLLDALIDMTTDEGAMVLDPFAGSGVTGAAAVKKGRKATLIEKSEKAVEENIKPRLKEAAGEREWKRLGFSTKKEMDAAVRDVKQSSEGLKESTVRRIIAGEIKFKPSETDASEWKEILGSRYYKVFQKTEALSLDEKMSELGYEDAEELKNDVSDELFNRFNSRLNTKSGHASIGEYRDGTPVTASNLNTIKTIEFPELVDLARELMGQVPQIRQKVSRHFGGEARGVFIGKGAGEIRLRADLFDPKISTLGQAAKTLAHEIGHLIDYLPSGNLARGNLLGRLLVLKRFQADFSAAAGASRTNKAIKQQLWELSKYWKPIDEAASAGTSFLKYRQSPPEVYADFISVLFNDPALANKMAPEAFNVFFEHLDKKPAVKDAYFELQAMLSGTREELVKQRRAGVQKMFEEGDVKAVDLQKQAQLEREARLRDTWRAMKFTLVDKNFPVIDRVREMQKKGVFINPDDNPVYMLEERNYLGGKVKAFMETDVVPVYQALQDADVTWGTFGEVLFYDRIIAGDRSTQANPRGITPEAATELRAALMESLDAKQQKVIEESAVAFRKSIKKVSEEAYKAGLYSKEMHDNMQKNENYVTYQVIEHIEDGMSSKVYKSIGTLKDITNPADASILKLVATMRAIERNGVTRSVVKFLQSNFKEDIEDAKTVWTGKTQRPIDPKDTDKKLLIAFEEGVGKGYYVDSYIASSVQNESIGQNKAVMAVMELIAYPNRTLFRPLFIGFNMGFQAFNFVRDFRRFWKNIPEMTFGNAIALYSGPARRLARVRAFGPKVGGGAMWDEAAADLQKLEREKVFSISFSDLLGGRIDEETQIELILKNSGISTFVQPARNKFWAPFARVLDFIQDLGTYIETLPKAAGYYHLSKGKALTAEERSYIRRFLGSPDFFTSGFAKPVTNEVFLFSNAIAQGIRSDIEIATMPKTRSAYWWKTAKIDLLPKFIMLGAALGLFGDWLKELMAGVSEYDKTSYTIIPLGTDENGKTIYFRLPHDETGRLVSGLLWKAISTLDPNNERDLGTSISDILSFTGGQIPSVTPTVSTASAIGQYLAGQNPYDSFRGRNIISDEVFKAGGLRATKELAGWVFNNVGGGIFIRFQKEFHPSKESYPEAFFGLPVLGNIVGRFFRVSDYGKTEKLREIKKNVESTEASRRLDDNEAVSEAIKNALEAGAESRIEKRKYELEIVDAVFPDKPKTADDVARARRLINKFRLGMTRGQGDPLINSLIDATSNAQKAAIIKDIRAGMTDEEYRAFKKEAITGDAASAEAFGIAEKN